MRGVLDPAGPQSAAIDELWWICLWVCVAVFVLVMAALAWAVWNSRRAALRTGTSPSTSPSTSLLERRLRRWVGAGVALSSMLLVGLLVDSVLTDRALARLSLDDALAI